MQDPGGGRRVPGPIVWVVVGVAVLIIVIALLWWLGRSQGGTTPISVPFVNKQSNVAPQETYENPFDRDTQYVNPFSEFKSPFHSLQ